MLEQDHCVYAEWSEKGFLILSFYVGILFTTRNDMELIGHRRNMCEANYVLKVKILGIIL